MKGSTVGRPASTRSKPRRWRRRKEDRPREILEAALELFVEHGFAAAKLEDVAQRAGVTKGTMYLYFASKEALFKAVVRAAVVPTLERAEQALAEHRGSSRELLDSLLREWWRTMEGSRTSGLPKLMISEAANFPELARFYHEEVVERAHRLTVAVLQRGIDAGEFRSMDVNYAARVLRAPILLGLAWKHSMMKADPEAMDAERYLDSTIDLVLHGVLSAPGWEMPYV
jgi:AcrR family transcriptional regulator